MPEVETIRRETVSYRRFFRSILSVYSQSGWVVIIHLSGGIGYPLAFDFSFRPRFICSLAPHARNRHLLDRPASLWSCQDVEQLEKNYRSKPSLQCNSIIGYLHALAFGKSRCGDLAHHAKNVPARSGRDGIYSAGLGRSEGGTLSFCPIM